MMFIRIYPKILHYGYCMSLCTNKVLLLALDKHKSIDILFRFLFATTTCFGCKHQPSSCRALVPRMSKGGVASP
jgi:hypothetical protein